MKDKLYKINDKVFQTELWFICSNKIDLIYKNVDKFRNKFNFRNSLDIAPEISGGECVSETAATGAFFHFIYLTKWDTTVLAHEVNHLVNRKLRALRIDNVTETEEVYSYYQDFWIREITQRYKGKR